MCVFLGCCHQAAHVEWITEVIQPVLLFSLCVLNPALPRWLDFHAFYALQMRIPVNIIPNSIHRSPLLSYSLCFRPLLLSGSLHLFLLLLLSTPPPLPFPTTCFLSLPIFLVLPPSPFSASDPYVKASLVCDGRRLKKRKTSIKKNTLNPTYNEALVFDIPNENIENVSIIIAVMDYDWWARWGVIIVKHAPGDFRSIQALLWSSCLLNVRFLRMRRDAAFGSSHFDALQLCWTRWGAPCESASLWMFPVLHRRAPHE